MFSTEKTILKLYLSAEKKAIREGQFRIFEITSGIYNSTNVKLTLNTLKD